MTFLKWHETSVYDYTSFGWTYCFYTKLHHPVGSAVRNRPCEAAGFAQSRKFISADLKLWCTCELEYWTNQRPIRETTGSYDHGEGAMTETSERSDLFEKGRVSLLGPSWKYSKLVKYWCFGMAANQTYNPKASALNELGMRLIDQLSHNLDLSANEGTESFSWWKRRFLHFS